MLAGGEVIAEALDWGTPGTCIGVGATSPPQAVESVIRIAAMASSSSNEVFKNAPDQVEFPRNL
jgi:hypothetical protein